MHGQASLILSLAIVQRSTFNNRGGKMGMGSCGVMDSWLGPALGLSVLAMGEAMRVS